MIRCKTGKHPDDVATQWQGCTENLGHHGIQGASDLACPEDKYASSPCIAKGSVLVTAFSAVKTLFGLDTRGSPYRQT